MLRAPGARRPPGRAADLFPLSQLPRDLTWLPVLMPALCRVWVLVRVKRFEGEDGDRQFNLSFISWSEVLRTRKCAPEACTGPHAPGRATVDRRVLDRKRRASAPARAATAGARRVWRAEALQWGHLPWTAVVRPLCRFATPGLPRAAGRQRARGASACRRRSARHGGGRSEQDLATSSCGACRQAALGRWSARAASSTATTGRRSVGSGMSRCAIMHGRRVWRCAWRSRMPSGATFRPGAGASREPPTASRRSSPSCRRSISARRIPTRCL